jgi:hypothetical protein
LFENIQARFINFAVGHDGVPIEPGNNYVPFVDNVRFSNIRGGRGCSISCGAVNGSKCHRMSLSGDLGDRCKCDACDSFGSNPRYSCKTRANSQFGVVTLPWGVCIPSDSPVNNDPDYPNWGPTYGDFTSLEECRVACSSSDIFVV